MAKFILKNQEISCQPKDILASPKQTSNAANCQN